MNVLMRRAAWMVLLAVVVLGLWRLRLDVQVLNLLPDEVPAVRGLKLYEDHFANANELVISLQGLDPAELEEAAKSLALELRQATNLVSEAVWTPPWLEHPEEMAEFMAYLWLNQPSQTVQELAGRLDRTNLLNELELTKQQLAISMSPEEIAKLSYDPFRLLELPGAESGSVPGFGNGADLFVSKDGQFRIMFVHAATSLRSYTASQKWLEAIRQNVDEWRLQSPLHNDVGLKFTGRPAFVSEISSSMEWDITTSVSGTMVIIAALFYWAHRRFKPLLWLITLLLLILLVTLSLGGLIFQTLNVISVGFAAILLGLAVDYGMVLYQEWINSRGQTPNEVRRAVGPSIIWAALSSSGAFLILNVGGLPGLAQLGTLVGLGVLVAAAVMLGFYLRPFQTAEHIALPHDSGKRVPGSGLLAWTVTALIIFGGMRVIMESPPRVNVSSEALRPAHSAAFAAVEEIKLRMERLQEPLWALAEGNDWDEVGRRLEFAERVVSEAVANGIISGATVPVAICPRPARQAANKPMLGTLAAREPEFTTAAQRAGFTTNAVVLVQAMFETWRGAAASPDSYVPRGHAGHWILERLISLDPGVHLALGLIHPLPEAGGKVEPELVSRLAEKGVTVTGWEILGSEIYRVIRKRFPMVFGIMAVLVLGCLLAAFRRVIPVLLSVAAVGLSGVLLVGIMHLADWHWNLMNLMSVPLLVGAGLDYGIHVQLALERHKGRIREMRQTVGRALFLCAATTVTGFSSLAWAGNPGLGSLGKICAAGIACAWFVAVWLLPAWWITFRRGATNRA